MPLIKYELTRGSDIIRDGMFLELAEAGTSTVRQIAGVFYSDVTHEYFLTSHEQNVPLEAIEKLISEAKKSLPPVALE